MDTIPQNTPQKQCTGPCGRMLPATLEFFDHQKSGKYNLRSRCKECRKEERRRPEIKEYNRTYHKAYRDSHPELQELKRAYYSRPEIQEQRRAYNKSYYNHPERRIHILANVHAYRNRPEIQEQRRAYNKSYYSENQEQIRARSKAWYYNPENRERCRDRVEAYQKVYGRRPETQKRRRDWKKTYRSSTEGHAIILANSRNRRARKRAAPGMLTSQQIQQKLRLQKFRCYYCSTKFEKQKGKYVYHLDHTIPLSRKEIQPRHDMSHTVLTCPTCNMKKGTRLPHEWFEGGRLL